MTSEEKQQIESQIKNDFSELQKKLENLKNEVNIETDETKKQKKNEEIQRLEKESSELKSLIDTLSSLQEQDLQSLKTRLESLKTAIQKFNGETSEILTEKVQTPTTYELLKGSETNQKLLTIISSNPDKFKKIPGETAEKKLEYVFSKIRSSVALFLKNKLGNSDKYDKVINSTIAPAFEWNLLEMLRDQGNELNGQMLQGMNEISWDGLGKLVNSVTNFAKKTRGSYDKFNQWVNALDYLSVHNGVLNNINKSLVLNNPLEFQNYLNDPVFAAENFSPYARIDKNIFKVDENQNFELGLSIQEKQQILSKIGNIKVVNNPRTTSLIVKLLDKPESFLKMAPGLQKTADGLLNGLNVISPVANVFGFDILGEISKSPAQRSFMCAIADFVCKLIGVTGGLEGIAKRWRLDRLNFTDDKNGNITKIFEGYQKLAGKGINISITDVNSCSSALANFSLTDLDKQSTTKGDYLRDIIAENMNITWIPPSVIQQTLGNDFLKKETELVNGKQKEKIVVDVEKITDDKKKALAHAHVNNMKLYLERNYNNLKDFYPNIHNIDDLAICMIASLYADKEDMVEGVKAKVFLPENYGVVRSAETVRDTSTGGESLDSVESSDKQKVSEKWVYDKAKEYGITDNRQIAYVLSTIKGESGFKNQKEIGGENKSYGKVDSTTGKAYYGRGFIQITHKGNYEKYTQIVKDSGKDFKDNDGNIIKGSEIDLVNNPDIILQSNDLAIFIAMDWMKNGGPSRQNTKRLDYYINDNKQDYYNARIIINGMSSNPKGYADRAQAYLDKLGKGLLNSPTESNEFLIGPKLLAHNKDEVGGLGNSIMNGFQGLSKKIHFPNMDGEIGMNTRTHSHRFKSKDDVSSYKKTHPGVKSFILYFGANNQNNQQTIGDITKWSEWLDSEGIQPVLCTNIGADVKKTSHLQELNQEILSLGKEKSRPVIDFAKQYSQGEIVLSSDSLHPKSYQKMTDTINGLLS